MNGIKQKYPKIKQWIQKLFKIFKRQPKRDSIQETKPNQIPVQDYSNYCFYSDLIEPVTLITPKQFITFQHFPHSQYKLNEFIDIYPISGLHISFKVQVSHIDIKYDFILLTSEFPVLPSWSAPILKSPSLGSLYYQLGISFNGDGQLTKSLNGMLKRDQNSWIGISKDKRSYCNEAGGGCFEPESNVLYGIKVKQLSNNRSRIISIGYILHECSIQIDLL
ncbi:hypothetical protein BC833DRAFT_602620 [Globomyces pollinis-pini]|nr:hypothetical protein BC833DRAFT_602620 [Globomyces pollinis-pini]